MKERSYSETFDFLSLEPERTRTLIFLTDGTRKGVMQIFNSIVGPKDGVMTLFLYETFCLVLLG